MKQFNAFLYKEFLEQKRTGKLMVLLILFCLFGIMNPAIAKLTPWMFEILSEDLEKSGMVINDIPVDALTSWTQFYKNIPIALVVFIVMFSGTLTNEYRKGTLVNIVTKGMKRYKILAAKAVVMVLLWTGGYLISFGITYGYNAYFWDNSIAKNLLFSIFAYYFAGLWLITVILLVSSFAQSSSLVMLSVGAAYVISYILGLIPKIKEYVPAYLMSSNEMLAGNIESSQCVWAVGITAGLIVFNVVMALVMFDRKAI